MTGVSLCHVSKISETEFLAARRVEALAGHCDGSINIESQPEHLLRSLLKS